MIIASIEGLHFPTAPTGEVKYVTMQKCIEIFYCEYVHIKKIFLYS